MKERIIDNIKIFHCDILPSTNRTALELDAEHLSAVVADRQSGGRGRLGRSFFSPDGGLYMSVILDPRRIFCGLPFCTAAAALAVKSALEDFGVTGLSVKWVNDILLGGRKVCGILTEARTENGEIGRVVVGIGINLKEPRDGFPAEIRHKAGAINFNGDKLELAAAIVKRLGEHLTLDARQIAEIYEGSLAHIGEVITVTDYADGQKAISGTLLGVDENCYLRLELENGEVRHVCSGEII
ncbi:MAG: biotin--[acetyl-CoA-carboxylase] ligase [Kiritimatiellae bacterium]|nr:biotin--[acetyl-CoA-carboxylase] ligase [Kiritimatiellia bacterium]